VLHTWDNPGENVGVFEKRFLRKMC